MLYINVRTTHDWGDDFAQYILQAKNLFHPSLIIESVTGLEKYSPQFRPIGFPLLLSPIYFFVGNNIYAFMLANSVLLIAICFLLFKLFNNYFLSSISFILVLVFAYNPYLLWFKSEVMPEFLFTLLLFAGILIHKNQKKNFRIHLIFIATALMLVKYIGVVFLLSIAVFNLLEYYQKIKNKSSLKTKWSDFGILVLPFVLYYLVNSIVFKQPIGSENWYTSYFFSPNLFDTLINNFIYYKDVFFNSLEQEVPFYINTIIKSFIILFVVVGIAIKFVKKFEMHDFIFLFYLIVLLLYPYTKGGYRFLFPLIPILLIYITFGINYFSEIPFFKKFYVTQIFLILILFSYRINIKTIILETPLVQSGPQEKEFVECKNYILQNTTLADCFMFPKPWAFNLFVDRKVVPAYSSDSKFRISQMMRKNKVKYIVACSSSSAELYDPEYLSNINSDTNIVRLWSNERYSVFKNKAFIP